MDLSSGVMEKLIIKMGSCEKEEEDNSVLIRHQVLLNVCQAGRREDYKYIFTFCQVGPGEGVVNLRASAAPIKGLKLNCEAKSSWKLTVDAVQVAIALFNARQYIMSRSPPFRVEDGNLNLLVAWIQVQWMPILSAASSIQSCLRRAVFSHSG